MYHDARSHERQMGLLKNADPRKLEFM